MSKKNSSRLIVNLLGIPSLLFIIYVGDNTFGIPLFSIFTGIVICLGVIEIPKFVKNLNGRPAVYILLSFIFILQFSRCPGIMWDFSDIFFIISLTVCTMVYELFRKQERPMLNISINLFAFIWLGMMLGSLSILRNLPDIGYIVTLILFLSIWFCDSAAYVMGKQFGKTKILPEVSPNKTWIGTISGLLASILFVVSLFYYNYLPQEFTLTNALILGLISGVFGQLGDFTESLLKREAQIKDSSELLMGHGGILDRFDSLIFAAPITLIYIKYFIIV